MLFIEQCSTFILLLVQVPFTSSLTGLSRYVSKSKYTCQHILCIGKAVSSSLNLILTHLRFNSIYVDISISVLWKFLSSAKRSQWWYLLIRRHRPFFLYSCSFIWELVTLVSQLILSRLMSDSAVDLLVLRGAIPFCPFLPEEYQQRQWRPPLR